MEQLNIVGKRSGEGIVTHKATVVNALSRGLADRLLLMDFTIGRKGLLTYIKSLAGSNIVKIVPDSNGSASEERADGEKRLKVVCGAFQSYLSDTAWINEKTPYSLAEVRFCANNKLTPNIGSLELAEAIARVLPFTATEDNRPALQCVLFRAGEGKLTLASADGFRLAECVLDYETEGDTVSVLVNRADLKGIPSALRKAKRVKVRFDKAGDTLDGMAMYIDTEIARYKFVSADGQFPDYDKLMPSECTCTAHLDTQEALKAVSSLKATAENPKDCQVDLTIGQGQMVMANTDDRGEVVVKADADSEAYIRVNGDYFADAMRAFGGMVDFSLSTAYSPMLFASDGFRVLVMPLMSQKATAQQRADAEVKGEEPEPQAEPIEAELEAEPTAAELEAIEAEVIADVIDEAIDEAEKPKPKRQRSRRREKVAVA